jgi:hypothetical protein
MPKEALRIKLVLLLMKKLSKPATIIMHKLNKSSIKLNDY